MRNRSFSARAAHGLVDKLAEFKEEVLRLGRMKFGVCLSHYGQMASLEGIRKIAVESEALGYDSIWATDHVLFQPMVGEPFQRTFECLTTTTLVVSL